MAVSADLPILGVGLTYSSAIEPLLLDHPELIDVLEIEPQTTWIKTTDVHSSYRMDEGLLAHLRTLPGRKLIHSVGTPVGGSVRPEASQLPLLREAIRYLDSPWASDHLSFNHTPEFATGFFLPPRQTANGIDTVVTAIADLQRALDVPVAVETGVNYLRLRPDELPDGRFVAQVVQRADCGLLLDLHNVFCNALNGRQPLDEYLAQVPLDRVWELHLAGGIEMDGYYLDAHSGAIPEPLYAVLEGLLPRLPNLRAMIFELFPSFVPVVGLELIREQFLRLRQLWSLRAVVPDPPPLPAPLRLEVDPPDLAPPEVWERALGSLVIGRPATDDLERELQRDPAIRLMNGLIFEFRASMIVGVLRLTSRLLMLTLGPPAFRVLVQDYCSKHPPQLYAGREADVFAGYLSATGLKVPHLNTIVAFEQATLATLLDGQIRVVTFNVEPIPLLRALAEGKLPSGPLTPGWFEIELTPDGPSSTQLNPEELRGAFPYH